MNYQKKDIFITQIYFFYSNYDDYYIDFFPDEIRKYYLFIKIKKQD